MDMSIFRDGRVHFRNSGTKALTYNYFPNFRHYMQGEALEERIHDAVSVVFEEMKKEKTSFDPTMYINFIVGNILTGLCFGGK